MGDLARCHKGLLKHDINTYNILILHVSRDSTCHFEEGQGPQVMCGPQDVSTIFKDVSGLNEVFYLLTKVECHHTTAYGHIQWKLDIKFVLGGADLNTKPRKILNTGNFTEIEREVRDKPYIKEYHMGVHCIINKIYVDTETDISHTRTLQNR